MLETIIIGVVCVLLAFLARYRQLSWAFPLSMIILFVFLGIRYNWGNDYPQYIDRFAIYNSIEQFNYFDPKERWEIGWIFLYRLFKPLGFFSLVIVLTAFELGVYYWFIKRYVPREWYWFAVFVFIFTPDLMLIEASMMRQTLAMCIVLLSVPFIFKKRFIIAALIILFASLFHSSAKIILPIVFLGYVNWRLGTRGVVIGVALFMVLLVARAIVSSIIEDTLSTIGLSKYTYYLEEGKEESELATGLGFIYKIFLMCLILYYEKKQDRERGLLFKLTALSFLIAPLGFIAQLIIRVGAYFQVSMLVTYPLLMRSIDNRLARALIILMVMTFTLYDFYTFFFSETWGLHFFEYHTIFESFVWK